MGARWLLPLLSACTWVSKQDVDDRLPQMDDDGDGYIASNDCNDGDANVHPGAAETWYDGTDQDCVGDDDYDADADGFLNTEDCDDVDPLVYPGGTDAPYDGVDNDCGEDDDYDQDGDGYVRSEDLGKATTGVPGSGALPGGDCDDLVPTVNPGVEDAYYDGQDTNCDGEDDYDFDHDGYVDDAYVGLATEYVEDSGALPGGDCDDNDGTIYPGAPDTWYDGIDADCALDDDYDQDVDGHQVDFSGTGDDCDDENPDVYPGATETIGDGVDDDCDGGEGTFPLSVPDLSADLYSLENPQSLRIRANSTQVFVGAGADLLQLVDDDGGTDDSYTTSFALAFSLDTLHDHAEGEPIVWAGLTGSSDYYLSSGHDFLLNDLLFMGANTQLNDTKANRSLYMGAVDLASLAQTAQNYTVNSLTDPSEDVSVIEDAADGAHMIACGQGGILQYAYYSLSTYYTSGEIGDISSLDNTTVKAKISGFEATSCTLSYLGTSQLYVLATQDAGLTISALTIDDSGNYTYDEDEVYLVDTLSAYTPVNIEVLTSPDTGEIYRIFYDASSGTILALDESDRAVLLDSSVSSSTVVRASFAPDGRLFLTYLDGGDAVLTYGTIEGTTFTGATLDILTEFTPSEVAVWTGDASGTGETDLVVAVINADNLVMGTAKVAP